jgi:hypothetical protein
VSAVSTDSVKVKKAKKAKAPKPALTEEEKAAKKAATAAKRAATIAAKPALTEEEKAAKKAATAAKRTATWAAKAAKKADDDKPAAIIGVTVPADPVANIVQAVSGPALTPALPAFQPELVEEVVSDDDEDGFDSVIEFEHEGTTYLKSQSDGALFDPKTNEPVGIWNDALKRVDALPADFDQE